MKKLDLDDSVLQSLKNKPQTDVSMALVMTLSTVRMAMAIEDILRYAEKHETPDRCKFLSEILIMAQMSMDDVARELYGKAKTAMSVVSADEAVANTKLVFQYIRDDGDVGSASDD